MKNIGNTSMLYRAKNDMDNIEKKIENPSRMEHLCNVYDDEITKMEQELRDLQKRYLNLEKNIKIMYKEYQQICSHDIMEGYYDSDGHKTVKSFVCKKCQYFTRYFPPYGSIIEWQ